MTAHFDDGKSLAFAFADLVEAGFREDTMSADFGGSSPALADDGTVPAGHAGLFERLSHLAERVRARASAPRHAPHIQQGSGADLTLAPGDRAAEAQAILERHGAVVVKA